MDAREPSVSPPGASESSDLDAADSVRRAIRLGLLIWPAFFLLDVFMCKLVRPDARLLPFLELRLLGELGILGTWWVVRDPARSIRAVLWANATMCLLAAVLVTIMARWLGGLESAYVHGISIIVLVEGAAIAVAWQRSLAVTLSTALTYPGVMVASAAFDDAIRAELSSRRALFAFASHYVFVLASALIATLVSHSVWRAKRELRETRRLRRYRLEVAIGKGGMNEVWLAWDEPLRRQVALKVLRAGPDPALISRFEREARATSQLTSPHTVRIFDFGASDDGVYFIAMEYLPGMDLRELVRRYGPVEPRRAAHFAVQACRSLAEAHERGIVHRDVKPANLFATRIDDDEDGLKVLDFGVARLLDTDPRSTLTDVRGAIGTPAYMAPETLTGSAADARSDVYSLGATLFHLLSGEPPFLGKTLHAVCVAQVTETAPPLVPRGGGSVPAALEAVVRRCLEKRPEARFESARELAQALEEALGAERWTTEDARRWWERARMEREVAPVSAPSSQRDVSGDRTAR